MSSVPSQLWVDVCANLSNREFADDLDDVVAAAGMFGGKLVNVGSDTTRLMVMGRVLIT